MKKFAGPIFTFLGACFFGLGGLFMKIIPWPAMAVNSARCLVAIFFVITFLIITKHKFRFNVYTVVAGLCITGTNILYSIANKMTTAANTIILQYTCPIFVILIALIVFKKKPTKVDLIACFFVMLGVIFFFVDGLSVGSSLGNILALCSGLTYAGVFMVNSLEEGDPLSSTVIGMVVSALTGLPTLISSASNGILDTSSKVLILVVCFGVFQLACGYIFFSMGIKRTPAVAASLISGVEAIVNPVLVAIFYKELITPLALIGAIIVFATIMTYNVFKAKES